MSDWLHFNFNATTLIRDVHKSPDEAIYQAVDFGPQLHRTASRVQYDVAADGAKSTNVNLHPNTPPTFPPLSFISTARTLIDTENYAYACASCKNAFFFN